MEQFEDTGGILPTHSIGVMIRGEGDSLGGFSGYVFGLGNGRGPVKDPAASFFNYNDNSVAFMGMLYHEWSSGLRLGPNFYFSSLPGGTEQNEDGSPLNAGPDLRPGATNTSSSAITGPKGTESILGFHAVYSSDHVEWLNEYQWMYHTYAGKQVKYDGTPATNTVINLFYSQISYSIGRWRPYARFELDQPNGVDAYLNAYVGAINPGLLGTVRTYNLGTRFELTPSSALKLELTYTNSSVPLEQQYFVGPAVLNNKNDFSTVLNWSVGW